MIICEETTDVTSSQDFESSNFTILASSKAFQILSSNVYTQKVRAVIREISTNAHDAHIEAGIQTPFKVHLPTSLEPWFSVRDFGPGISNESMFNLYTQFFKSTRTSSNDFCGALGIGRMAPFTIVDSFLVTSFRGGHANTYCVFKDERGTPKLSLLSANKTDEPDGLQVHVQVERGLFEKFKEEAAFVYSFFKQIPEINDPSVLSEIQKNNAFDIEADDYKINYKKERIYHELYAVMGNVAYSIDRSAYSKEIPFDLYGQIEFEMGSLSFNPGRESLALDKTTLENIKKKLGGLRDAVIKNTIQKISDIENLFEKYLFASTIGISEVRASKNWINVMNYYDNYHNSYKPEQDRLEEYTIYYPHYYRQSVCEKQTIKPQENCEYFIKNDKVKISRERIRAYVLSTKKNVAIVSQENADAMHIPTSRIFSVDKIPTIKRAPKASTSSTKIDKLCVNGYRTTTTVIPAEDKVYVEGMGTSRNSDHPWMNSDYKIKKILKFLLKHDLIDRTFHVFLVKSSMAKTKKFKGDSSWIKFEDFLKKKVDGKIFYTYNDLDENTAQKISRMYKLLPNNKNIQEKTEFIKEYKEYKENYDCDGIEEVPFVKFENHPICKKVGEFSKKYPMISIIDSYNMFSKENLDVVVDYIQTVDKNQGE